MLLALDPGLRGPGLALFNGAEELVTCTTFGVPENRGAEAWLEAVDKAMTWLANEAPDVHITELVYEMMECYEQNSSAKNNDLLECVGSGSGIITMVALYNTGLKVKGYTPNDWKGTKKKPIVHRRAKKRLSKREKKTLKACLSSLPKGLHHNALDAVSIGLVHLYRMRP